MSVESGVPARDTHRVRVSREAPKNMPDTQQPRRGEPQIDRGGTPKMYRRRSPRVLAGVASGLADHLGVRVVWVRLAFTLLSVLSGMGLFAYALLWMFVPQRASGEQEESGSRRERQQGFGLLVLGAGLTVAAGSVYGLFSGWGTVPIAVAVVGAAVVWHEADESQRRRWRVSTRDGVAGMFRGGGGVGAAVRIFAGIALVATAILVVVLRNGSFDQVRFALLAVVAALVGVAVLTVPFWLRQARDLSEERKARIRTDERAAIAAHLHDSVLQTLALIQKQSESSREVAWLARRQERELRGWLYGPSGYRSGADVAGPAGGQEATEAVSEHSGQHDTGLSSALARACAEVEDRFGVSVQPVVVGDIELDERVLALVQAGREAVVNAAKHAGVDEVSVYTEVEETKATLFVRDRGVGFDPAAVAADRHGLADSVRGRIERSGGSCRLRTTPGEGTEVQLELPLRTNRRTMSEEVA